MKGKKLELTRRGFLKGAAALAAAPAIIPASALGRDGTVAPSERIVMGGIGVGNRGMHDLRQLMRYPDCQFVADADPREERRQRVKETIDKQYGNSDCQLYVDFRELLERDDIDACLIATGDRWHSLLAMAAMKAGKDVYCEKPCSMAIAEGRAMADTQKRYGRVYQAGTQRRSEPNFVFIMELARTGRLGKLHTMWAHIVARMAAHMWLPEQEMPPGEQLAWDLFMGPTPWRPYNRGYIGWHWRYDMHGGGIPEWLSHTGDMCQWANDSQNTGPVEFEFPNNDDAEGLTCHYANGVKMIFKGGGAFPGTCGVRFIGTEGWAECSDGQPATFEPKSLGDEREKVMNDYVERTGRSLDHWRNFLDCVKSRKQPVAPAPVAHRSVSIAHVSNICMWLQRDMKWNPAKEEFIGDDEANRMRTRPMRAPWQT